MRRLEFIENDDVLESIPTIIEHLRSNEVIAYPTETVYGFGSLVQQEALERVAQLKERDETKPFLLLVSNAAQCAQLKWNEPARKLAQAFWPGPLTLALTATSGEFPQRVLSPQGTVAVRETPHPALRMLLDALGEPITSTSANLPRSAPAASADQVATILEAMGAANVLLLDGGVLPPMKPSTLVDCSVDPIRVLRVGSISVDALRKVVEQIDA